MASGNGAEPRRLLVGGERLRIRTDRPRSGGGSKYYPFEVEAAAARLLDQAARVRAIATELPPRLRASHIVFEAVLMPNFLANSYFPGHLLDYLDASMVGSRYGQAPHRKSRDPEGEIAPTKTLFIAADDAGLDRLESVLANPTAGGIPRRVREDLRVLEALRLPEPADRRRGRHADLASDAPLFEAVLHPSAGVRGGRPQPADEEVLGKWADLVASVGGRVETEWMRVVGDMTFVPVRLPETAVARVSEFNPLRAVRPMAGLREWESVESRQPGPLTPPADAGTLPRADVLRVAVFDGGCEEGSPYYAGRVRELTVGSIVPHAGARRHGALVTSALLYGHAPAIPLEPADVLVDHYQVVPAENQRGFEMYWLLDVIRDVVLNNDYHVVNISLGPKLVVDDDLVDRWTSELDSLAHDRGVLFVIAAGNDGDNAATELRRVQVPGDMVNALTVGACGSMAPARRASYSSVGPGRAGARLQPSGMAFGGEPHDPFLGIDSDGNIIGHHGTSFAAPFVIHGLSDLVSRGGIALANPSTLRAFALHFARAAHRDESLEDAGCGVFAVDYSEISDCAQNVVHVLYRGDIARDEYVPLVLPLPDGVPGRIKLSWALATTVGVNGADAVEYAKAGLEVVFRPHANKRSFTRSGSGAVIVDVAADEQEAARLIAAGYSPSQEPASETPKTYRGESVLREEGKWETIRRSAVKRFNPGRLHRPRLDLSHIAREGGALAYGTQDLQYSLLVTLAAEKGVPLYDQVRLSFPVLVPITASVEVSAEAG